MCLILFAYKTHPDYFLILAANRDEFYDRPTEKLGFWDKQKTVLAGKDIKAGGTWLGLAKGKRIAAITNYRDPKLIKKNALSRGLIVSRFLTSKQSPNEYMQNIEGRKYNGFNLLAGTAKNGLFYYCNLNEDTKKIEPGIHGLSNKFLNTPWPKIEKGKNRLQNILESGKNLDIEAIFDLLSDREVFNDSLLPNTGISIEWERVLSSIFIKTDIYGTRSSSVILWGNDGNIKFIERTTGKGFENFDMASY